MLETREEIKTKVEKMGATITGLENVPHIVQARPLFDFVGVDEDILKKLNQNDDDIFAGKGSHNVAVFPDGRIEDLKIVSSQYNLIQHLDAINSTLDHIPEEFKLDKIKVHVSPDGGRIWADFSSAKMIEIFPKDKLRFLATMQNSADTSKLYRMIARVMREVCTNGMEAPDSRFDQINIRKLHKGAIDMDSQIKGFFANMEENLAVVNAWKGYGEKKVAIPELESVFKMLEVGPRVQDEILNLELRGEKTSVKTLLDKNTLTAWNVYNSFTQRITDSDSLHSVKISNGQKVTQAFDDLIAA